MAEHIKEKETIDRLEKLGFKKANQKLKELSEKKRKLAIAYEHYRFVRKEKFDKFSKELIEKTRKSERVEEGHYFFYRDTCQELVFSKIEDYSEVPPNDVLEKLEEAQGRNCFDNYVVAYIQNVQQVRAPDPILFGVVNGCSDKFFIAQWDDDVKIEDILGPNEG